jgi:hypothetical protein
MNTMSKVMIDDVEYEIESLTDDAKAQMISMQFADGEIARLQLQLAAMQTARNSYASALKAALQEHLKS